MGICVYCKKEFYNKRKDNKYCSKKCRDNACYHKNSERILKKLRKNEVFEKGQIINNYVIIDKSDKRYHRQVLYECRDLSKNSNVLITAIKLRKLKNNK